jgi:3-oxoacyl-[acyl-carrier protein] reductase
MDDEKGALTMLDTGIQGKVVLVTGANSPYGIGAAAARAFAKQGAAVFLTYLRQQIDLSPQAAADPAQPNMPGEAFYRASQQLTADVVVERIRAYGGRVAALEADLADPAVIPQLFDRAEQTFGPVEVLVNNAAYCAPDTFIPPARLGLDDRSAGGSVLEPITAASHDRHFAVNSRAVALTMAEFARRQVARGASWGRIINISTDGAPGFSSEVSYGASKYALESYSRAAAKELGQLGITVNVLSLGPIQTGWISPELERSIAEHTPMGRVGQPEDVADAMLLLAAEQARWLTGQVIYVGGGHRMI